MILCHYLLFRAFLGVLNLLFRESRYFEREKQGSAEPCFVLK